VTSSPTSNPSTVVIPRNLRRGIRRGTLSVLPEQSRIPDSYSGPHVTITLWVSGVVTWFLDSTAARLAGVCGLCEASASFVIFFKFSSGVIKKVARDRRGAMHGGVRNTSL
jgi:hypothetical protein